MLRDYPASVRAAVLDSVYMPPSVDYYADLRWAAAQALERVFATCAAAADCARAFPDLKGRFLALVERLNQSPLTFTLAAPVRDERAAPTKAKLSGASLVGLLYRLMYEDFNIKSVPGLIVALEAGDTRLLPTLLIDPIREPALYSEAMNHSIHCSEVAPFSVFTSTPAADPPVDPLYEGFYHFDVNPLAFQRFCPRWPTKPPTPNQNDPVRSDRPVLILAGAYDPASPVKHARVASATLSNSVYVEFPAQAHAVYTYDASGCAKAITRRFLDAPDTRPDVSCVDRLPAIHFLPPSAAR
jgi:pimeloyl-ACP methyl ester carboxylesterase